MKILKSKDPEKIVCLVLILGVVAAYIWAIASRAGIPAMWLDELSVRCAYATKPLSTLLKSPVSLSYILCKFLDGIYYNDFFVRMPMIVGGLMIILGTYWTVAQFGSRYVGVLAAWTMLWYPLFTGHVLKNRFYILGTGFMYCSWALAVWALKKNKLYAWGIYAFVAFVAAHIFPWNAPWIGLIAIAFTLPVILKSWKKNNLIKSLISSFIKLFLLGLPVLLFGVHYLFMSGKIESIAKSGNDSFWKEPVDIGINYILEILRETLQPLYTVNVEYLLLLLILSVFIATILREWKLLVFAACTIIVWLAAVYMCNQTNIVPISRRIMFSRLNFIVVLFGGLSVLIKYFSQFNFWKIVRKNRKFYFSLHIIAGFFILYISLSYGWDKMIVTRGKVSYNHSSPFDTYGQIINDNISSNACIIVQEDGRGLSWAIDAYAVKPYKLNDVFVKTYWPRSYSNHRLQKKDLQNFLKKYSQVWIISLPGYINRDVLDILNKNSVKIPFEHNIWIAENKFRGLDDAQKNDWLRKKSLEINSNNPPLDVAQSAISNLIVNLSAEDIKNNFMLIMDQNSRRHNDNYKLADLLGRFNLHDEAIDVVMAPIYFQSRHTSMYEELGRRLLEIAKIYSGDTKNKYQAAALNLYKSALTRNSPTAINKFNEVSNIIRMNNGVKNISKKFVFDENDDILFQAMCPNEKDSSTRFSYTNTAKFASAKSISIAALFKTSSNTALNIVVARGKGRSNADSPWWLSILNNGNHTQFVMEFLDENSEHFEERLTASWDNIWNENWHCFVGTFDDETKKMCFYIDGYLVNSRKLDKNVKRNITDVPLTIGCLFGESYPFKGQISEVAIYNKALSPNKIKSFWNKIERSQKK